MEDTTPEIKRKFYEILMSRTEEERFLMCAEMYESAREIIVSEMPKDLTENDCKKYVYEKIHHETFPNEF
ncbi:MAG: hypothetical protein JWN60_2857 [Acidobacteria bacterium]|jgi:hypothetical protein|nr:hypothetical protein [Acidobacteriota bacterium]